MAVKPFSPCKEIHKCMKWECGGEVLYVSYKMLHCTKNADYKIIKTHQGLLGLFSQKHLHQVKHRALSTSRKTMNYTEMTLDRCRETEQKQSMITLSENQRYI